MDLTPLLLLLIGVVLLWLGRRTYAETGLPRGRVVSRDTIDWERPPRALVSHRHRLAGRPDYLVREGDVLIPVEAKPARRAETPYESDVVQLLAYCLLVEETEGRPPPYGLLLYADRQWRFEYTPQARETVLTLLDDLNADRNATNVPRSHDHAARCRACSQRTNCSEALA